MSTLKSTVQDLQEKKKELQQAQKTVKVEIRKVDQALKAIQKIDGTTPTRRKRRKQRNKTTQARTGIRRTRRKPLRAGTNKAVVLEVIQEGGSLTSNEILQRVDNLNLHNVQNIVCDLVKRGYITKNSERPAKYTAK